MSVERVDVAIVGGGIVGLAVARELGQRRPDLRVAVLEQEPAIAQHQTGRNSGVIHAGLYYTPGSLKARLCREGKIALEAYATERAIPFERCGKLVVATKASELERLDNLRVRAETNGVPGLEVVGPGRIAEIEPHVTGIRGLWSPGTGIIDFRQVAHAYADDVIRGGGAIELGRTVMGIRAKAHGVVVATSRGDCVARYAITCAGVWADRVAGMSADQGPERMIPFRGDYYTMSPDARHLVRGLIYPVPDPRFPFLGVHLTRRIDGEVLAGPNAVLAAGRTAYRRRDVNLRELVDIVTYPGFLRLAARYWRYGLAEMWRDLVKSAFLHEIQRFVPEVRADQIRFGPSGIRAQALDRDGSLVDDFRLRGTARVVHVVNAPSPAATASLAIAAHVVDEAARRFEL